MPTVCEIVIELKKKGIKNYSGKKKAELEEMLKSGNSAPKKQSKKQEPKKQTKKDDTPSWLLKAEKTLNPKKEEPKKPLLLKLKEEEDKPIPTKKPPLANKPLHEIYILILSLEKKIKDNINDNEKKNTITTLEKYKTAYRYIRTKFMSSIAAMSTKDLNKLKKSFILKLSNITNDNARLIINQQLGEIDKYL
jgi:hypothetical protein